MINEHSKVAITVMVPGSNVLQYTSTLEDHNVRFEEGGLMNIELSPSHRVAFAPGFWQSVEVEVTDED